MGETTRDYRPNRVAYFGNGLYDWQTTTGATMDGIISIVWDHGEGGNVEHVARHRVTPEEVDDVLLDPLDEMPSASSDATIRTGFTGAGRQLVVVFVWIDPGVVYPITAYEPEPES